VVGVNRRFLMCRCDILLWCTACLLFCASQAGVAIKTVKVLIDIILNAFAHWISVSVLDAAYPKYPLGFLTVGSAWRTGVVSCQRSTIRVG
jgi:hypothetical protein